MYQKISTEKMEREEWLALRKTGIGGSDAGTLFLLRRGKNLIQTLQ